MVSTVNNKTADVIIVVTPKESRSCVIINSILFWPACVDLRALELLVKLSKAEIHTNYRDLKVKKIDFATQIIAILSKNRNNLCPQ